jgi:hypothetical protein
MDFPDMESLEWAASAHGFRKPKDGETEESYRLALHHHVKPVDRVESFEILFGVGWDKFTHLQKMEMLVS